jgi:hypothetical protein
MNVVRLDLSLVSVSVLPWILTLLNGLMKSISEKIEIKKINK